MARHRLSRTQTMRLLLAAVAVAAIVVWLLLPKKEEVKRYVPNASDGETTPTMATTDVSTLISDSGYTKYHVTAPLWQMFEDAEEPFWKFPLGMELEQYDPEMRPESTVICDSAIYFSRKRLWRLDGNVVMVNTQADSFLTQQLFWDQSARKIYSDSFIHIVRTDRTIEGFGFESDQSMLYYTVHRPTAILPADRRPGRKSANPDTVNATSTDVQPDTNTVARRRKPAPERKHPQMHIKEEAKAMPVRPGENSTDRKDSPKNSFTRQIPNKKI